LVLAGHGARPQAEDSSVITSFDGMQKSGREGVEMAMKSYGSLSQGLQAIAVEAAEYSRKSFETSTSTLEKVLASGSFESALQLQAEYLKNAYEGYLGEVSKLGTMVSDTTREAYKPYEGLFGKFAK
jgi:hypothetical protein